MRIILERVLKTQVGSVWTEFNGSGWGPVVGSCEHGNKHSGSIQGGEFLDRLVVVTFSRRTLLHGVSELISVSYIGSVHK